MTDGTVGVLVYLIITPVTSPAKEENLN